MVCVGSCPVRVCQTTELVGPSMSHSLGNVSTGVRGGTRKECQTVRMSIVKRPLRSVLSQVRRRCVLGVKILRED